MIPTRRICEKLWTDMQLADGLKNHMASVAGLAVRTGTALNKTGYKLDIPLIEAASLLHDIAKGTPHHAETGAEKLEALGLNEVAPLVKAHMRLPYGFIPEISEFSVVFLADKMFIGSEAVNLEKRYSEKMLAYRDQPILFKIVSNQLEMSLKLEKLFKTVLGADSLLLLP